MLTKVKDRPARIILFFLFMFNTLFGLAAIIFPLDIAAIEFDLSGGHSFYDSLPEDTSPGVLNFTFWTGTLSGMMRMGGAFRLGLGIGFGLILFAGPSNKWPIFLMAFVVNLSIIFIVYIIEPGQGADGNYTSSGTDNARLFQIFHLFILVFAYFRLLDEGVSDDIPKSLKFLKFKK